MANPRLPERDLTLVEGRGWGVTSRCDGPHRLASWIYATFHIGYREHTTICRKGAI